MGQTGRGQRLGFQTRHMKENLSQSTDAPVKRSAVLFVVLANTLQADGASSEAPHVPVSGWALDTRNMEAWQLANLPWETEDR